MCICNDRFQCNVITKTYYCSDSDLQIDSDLLCTEVFHVEHSHGRLVEMFHVEHY